MLHSFFNRSINFFGGVILMLSYMVGSYASANTSNLPRVASLNMCTDQLLLLLAKPEQILSVSSLSHDQSGSYLFEQARKFPSNSGSSEQILQQAPDTVLAGQYTTRSSVTLLRELGLRVEIIPIANDLDTLFNNIGVVAKAIGRQERGEQVVAQLKDRLEQIELKHSQRTGSDPSALYLDANGYTVGAATLRGQVLSLAGWVNAAERWGIKHYGTLSLESLIKLSPDVLIDAPYSEAYSRGQQLLEHPAIHSRGINPQVFPVPSRQTICAGPWTVDLIETLQAERSEWVRSRPLADRKVTE